MTIIQNVKRLRPEAQTMGHSQAEKARNRERILDEASTRIRQEGLDAISVAGLMQAVDLTHGGFYNHFGSRSELLVEALQRALAQGAGNGRFAAEGAASDGKGWFGGFVRRYLSPSHRDHPESGCAIAALLSEVGRSEDELRAPMNGQVDQLIAAAAEATGDEDRAMLAVSALIGALALSRVIVDPSESGALLRSVKKQILAMTD